MKTAEEYFTEAERKEVDRIIDLTERQQLGEGDDNIQAWKGFIISAMKDYAKEAAQDALNRAADNATGSLTYIEGFPLVVVNERSILNTEILTP